jgi:large subunit ribosomal protein L18
MARARGPTYRVPFRRRREGKTNYHRRLKLIISRQPRMVVRKSNRYIRLQLITAEKEGDRTHVAAISSELPGYGYSGGLANAPAAYLTGLLFGRRAVEAGYDEMILDKGLQRQVAAGTIYAALRGALESGVAIPHDAGVLPDDERTFGQIIASFKGDSAYIELVKNVKGKLLGEQRAALAH